MEIPKILLLTKLTLLTSQFTFAAPCSFDSSKSCQLIRDILNDKSAQGLHFYAPTNYDHRISGEINVYDASLVKPGANGGLTFVANLMNPGYWLAGEIMTRQDLRSPPFNAPVASEVWTTKETTHGYIEVNVTLPICTKSTDNLCQNSTNPKEYNTGLWPAIWMMPTYDGNWPQNGEIDIMEAYPKNTPFNITTGALHFNGNDSRCSFNDCRGAGFPLEWHEFPELAYAKAHTWGFEWEKDPNSSRNGYILTGYIDNKKTWGPLVTDQLPADGANAFSRGFNDPAGGFYLIINLAIGGPYAGAPHPKMQAASMQLNTVKFYQVAKSEPTGQCDVPVNISSNYTQDKRNITLNWKSPSSEVKSYRIKDWQKRVLWEGTNVSWTDTTLPGTAGKFTYFLSSVCVNKTSGDIQYDAIIPEVTQCEPPTQIVGIASADKKRIKLTWSRPTIGLSVTGFEVRDWLKRVLWQGNSLSWTDTSLPGHDGKFTYFINSKCNNVSSNIIQKDVYIQ